MCFHTPTVRRTAHSIVDGYYVCSGVWNFFSTEWFLTHHSLESFGIFWQFDLAFSLLFRYLLFFVVNVLWSLLEAFRCSGSRNIRRLKQVTMTLADGWWQFGRWMSRKCHIFQAVWKWNLVFCPSWKQHFIALSINLYPTLSMSYKCTWKFLE